MKDGCSFVWHSQESNSGPSSGLTPRSRYKHAACIYDCRVYIFGGKDGNLPLKDLWRFDLKTNTWECLKWTGDRLPNLQEHTMVPYQNRIYIFGGNFQFGADPDIPFWILDLESLVCKKQNVIGVVPEGRRGHTAVVYKDAMYIFAGFIDMKRSSNELWAFNFNLGKWSLLDPEDGVFPVGRHSHSAVVYRHFMCVYGGLADLETKDDLWIWDFNASRWTRLRSSQGPPPLEGHSAAVAGNLMILFGGSHDGVLQNDLWAFDFDRGIWQKLTCKGTEQIPRSKHTALLTSHGDWCWRPSCIDLTVSLRRAASCPASSVVAAQRGTRLTSSSRLVNEKNYPPKFSHCSVEFKSQGHEKLPANGATYESINEPVLFSEDVLYRSSAKLEVFPLISGPDANFCPSLGVTNPAAVELQESDLVPVRTNGLLYPDGFQEYREVKPYSVNSSLIINDVHETNEKIGNFFGDFSKVGSAATFKSKVNYAENLSTEEAEAKNRHVLAASLLGTPTKSKTASNKSLSEDGSSRMESPLESGSPHLVEMNFFRHETKRRKSPSTDSLILLDLEKPDAKTDVSFISYDGVYSPKIKEMEQTQFLNSVTDLALADPTEDGTRCFKGRGVKEAWASPSRSVTTVDGQVSPDDVAVETRKYQQHGHSSTSSSMATEDRPQCRVELFQAKSKQTFQCPEFCMFVFGGRTASSATKFEVQTISVSRLEISLGLMPTG